MNNRDLICYLMGLMVPKSCEYINEFDSEYSFDKDVIDCQFKLYIVMLIDSSQSDFNRRYEEFVEAYNKLSLDKQEFIKRDIMDIFKKQDENSKEKEKIL